MYGKKILRQWTVSKILVMFILGDVYSFFLISGGYICICVQETNRAWGNIWIPWAILVKTMTNIDFVWSCYNNKLKSHMLEYSLFSSTWMFLVIYLAFQNLNNCQLQVQLQSKEYFNVWICDVIFSVHYLPRCDFSSTLSMMCISNR
jgi:hypothetical protein